MNKIIYIIGCCLCWVLSGCEQKLDTWSGKDVAYFDENLDSTVVSFVYIDSRYDYDTVRLQVNVMGNVTDHKSRYVTVRIAETNATAGVDYTALEQTYEIKPGNIFCTVPICLKRNEGLKKEVKYMQLELAANSDFELYYQEDVLTSGSDLKFTKISHRITFHEMMLEPPSTWSEYYFGKFTPRKFEEICDQMEIPRARFIDPRYMTFGRIAFVANSMKNYLDRLKDADTPVMDEDGTEMRMGDFLY